MSDLTEYVLKHATRGECKCGKCADRGDRPDPDGHLADLFFFKVGVAGKPDGDTLRRLISEHKGEYADCNPLDGAEHSYIELGGWIGDQGLAMMLMGLGSHLGLWSVMTPNNMMPGLDEETKKMVAGMGLVSIMGK